MSVQNGKNTMRSEHRKHDRLLVARFAMDDAYPSERDEARLLIQSCPDCAALAADIKQISNAVGQVPVPPRTRDFAISAEKAQELRGSRLSRWMRGFATPGRSTLLRPVAGVALSIGLVMAVVGTALPATQPASAPQGGALTLGATEAPSEVQPLPTDVQEPGGPPPVAAPGGEANGQDTGRDVPVSAEDFETASHDPITQEFNAAYASPDAALAPVAGDADQLATTESRDTTRDLLLWAGLLIALISAALLALAWIARRYFADPLLR